MVGEKVSPWVVFLLSFSLFYDNVSRENCFLWCKIIEDYRDEGFFLV